MRSQLLATFIAAAVVALSATAGEPTYRSVMPDGSVRYGEAPEAGAKEAKKLPPARAATGTVLVTPEEKRKALGLQSLPGGTVVLPPPARAGEPALESGVLQSPPRLPERRY